MPKIRARYKVVGPKLITRMKRIHFMDESGSLQSKEEEVSEKTWMVYFPQGHSIRVDEANLRLNKLHLKPRLVDMDSGDVLDIGGDEYDLDKDIPDRELELVEDTELLEGNSASQKGAIAKAK